MKVEELINHAMKVQIGRYFAVGLLCWVIETTALMILYGGLNVHNYASIPIFDVKIDFFLLFSDGLSAVIAFCFSFYLNRRWTFKR